MKKQLVFVVSLLACLLLSACGQSAAVSGEVVEAGPEMLVVQTQDGQRAAVLLEEDTVISGMEDIDGEAYKKDPHTGVKVNFFPTGRAGSAAAADGTKIKAYRTKNILTIWAHLVPDAVTMPDGTVLDAWKTAYGETDYQTKDGVELLREQTFPGPEEANLEGMEALSEAAKPVVTEFYQKQGKLYDLQAELAQALQAYRADPAAFSALTVSQNTSQSALSEKVLYFKTDLVRTAGDESGQETALCAAFDRETGKNIPLAELFTCPESEIGQALLQLVEKDGSAPVDTALKAEIQQAFQTDYLCFLPDTLLLQFPQGTLPGREQQYRMYIALSEECRALLYPWAVPYSAEG